VSGSDSPVNHDGSLSYAGNSCSANAVRFRGGHAKKSTFCNSAISRIDKAGTEHSKRPAKLCIPAVIIPLFSFLRATKQVALYSFSARLNLPGWGNSNLFILLNNCIIQLFYIFIVIKPINDYHHE
jgi:hypothetical protein